MDVIKSTPITRTRTRTRKVGVGVIGDIQETMHLVETEGIPEISVVKGKEIVVEGTAMLGGAANNPLIVPTGTHTKKVIKTMGKTTSK